MAHATEHHGHATLVGSRNHFVIAHRAAGLDDASGTCVDHHVQTVAEREEGVAGDHSASQREIRVAGLDAGDAGRVQAAHLAGAHTHGHAALAEDDGVGLDELGHVPGEQQVVQLVLGGLLGGHHFQVSQGQLVGVGRLNQDAGADAFHVHGVAAIVPIGCAALGQVDLQDAHIHLGLEDGQRGGREAGRHQHFHKLLGDLLRSRFVQLGVQGNDAAKG